MSYEGPAEVGELAVMVHLSGRWEPVDGRYHWGGRIEPFDEIAALVRAGRREVSLRIGERSAAIRQRICEASAWLGLEIDRRDNESDGPRISTLGSKVEAWVVPTNEELVIARHTGQLLGLIEARV